MRAGNRRAFTLIELLTVMAIISLLISILMPALGRARELARRTVCLANLRAIGQGCITYSTSNKGHFPYWGQKAAGFNAVGDAWDWDGLSPNTFNGTAAPDYSPISNTRNLWKLVQLQAADTKTFLCPSDGEGGDPFTPAVLKSTLPNRSSISDVQNRSQCSYAFQYQGPALEPGSTTKVREGWPTAERQDPKLVILADTSPAFRAKNLTAVATSEDHTFELASSTTSVTFPAGNNYVAALNNIPDASIVWDATTATARYTLNNPKDLESLNSPNHRGEGQNYIRLDGSGDFSFDPWAGAHKDNIWTVQDSSVYASGNTDSVMLRGRMKGLFDAATADETVLLQNWVVRQESKNTYPDSWLVP
jgi:prepilin-type N-terminal cleavage/methylation domain-containing protein